MKRMALCVLVSMWTMKTKKNAVKIETAVRTKENRFVSPLIEKGFSLISLVRSNSYSAQTNLHPTASTDFIDLSQRKGI